MQFNVLQADFEYNLQLLEDRDRELQQYDSDAAVQAATLADRARQVAELQAACEEAQKGVLCDLWLLEQRCAVGREKGGGVKRGGRHGSVGWHGRALQECRCGVEADMPAGRRMAVLPVARLFVAPHCVAFGCAVPLSYLRHSARCTALGSTAAGLATSGGTGCCLVGIGSVILTGMVLHSASSQCVMHYGSCTTCHAVCVMHYESCLQGCAAALNLPTRQLCGKPTTLCGTALVLCGMRC